MKTEAIVAARLEFNESGIPRSTAYDDIYHPRAGALVQARHVFLAGNELPRRWHGRHAFVILETGFGLGNNFLATWQAWRADPDRCDRLTFVSVEQHPLRQVDLAALPRDTELAALAQALVAAWPQPTPNMHRLVFDGGRVELLLALGDVQHWLPELRLRADAFFLDGFAPARNPQMWDLQVCKALGRLAAPDATLATWTAAAAVRAGLTTAGFELRLGAGTGGKRDILLGRYAPRFTPRLAPQQRHPSKAPSERSTSQGGRRAVIVGAGLAGCATAWALADRGWSSSLLERGPTIAGEASGNPAGLFHGIVNPQDGVHARLLRAAALEVRSAVVTAIADHGVAGSVGGLLRLETALPLAAMEQLLARLGLPTGYVRACSAIEVERLAGVSPGLPAWFYPGGGWVQPAGLARSFVQRAGARLDLRTGAMVHSLRRAGGGWQALDVHDSIIDEAEVLVLANAGDARRLLGEATWAGLHLEWRTTRGQVSLCRTADLPPPLAGCRLPMAGAGYMIPLPDGQLLFGATSQPGDNDPEVRTEDHLQNLAQLRRLTGLPLADIEPRSLTGRTAWRWSTDDRLPLVGALPVLSGGAPSSPMVGPRNGNLGRLAREPGLFLFAGLGSRGIVWSALCAQTLAAEISGSPLPIESSLQAAIDPARFLLRACRRHRPDRSSNRGADPTQVAG